VVRVQVKDGPARITSAQRSSATTFITPLILDPSISPRAHSTSNPGPVCLSEGRLLEAQSFTATALAIAVQLNSQPAVLLYPTNAPRSRSTPFGSCTYTASCNLQHPLESVPNLDPSINATATATHCNHVVAYGRHRPGDERAPRCEEERWR
jgi:hypothetical protein